MNSYDEADVLLLLGIAEDFYEWIGGERQTEVDRIWRAYSGSLPFNVSALESKEAS